MKNMLLGVSLGLLFNSYVFADVPTEASVREFLKVKDAETQFHKKVEGLIASLDALNDMESLMSDLPQQAGIMHEKIATIYRSTLSWDLVEPKLVQSYQHIYTQQEINFLLQMYESEVGRAVMEKEMTVKQQEDRIAGDLMSPLQPKIAQIINDTLTK